ncbi:hypothetical protein FRC08_005582 [Ceratobasidium sp. 394]|nr:hypothetical protein FRC08_005582 [Ceratobasidium sp. 394]
MAIKIICAVPKYRDASKTEIRALQRSQEPDPHYMRNLIKDMILAIILEPLVDDIIALSNGVELPIFNPQNWRDRNAPCGPTRPRSSSIGSHGSSAQATLGLRLKKIIVCIAKCGSIAARCLEDTQGRL